MSDCKTECELSEAHSCTPSSSPHGLTPSSPFQIAALDAERGRLHDQVSESRSNAGRLEASLAADVAVISEVREVGKSQPPLGWGGHRVLPMGKGMQGGSGELTANVAILFRGERDRAVSQAASRAPGWMDEHNSSPQPTPLSTTQLRGRLSSAESRLDGEQSTRLELSGRLMSAEMQLRGAQERVSELTLAAAGETHPAKADHARSPSLASHIPRPLPSSPPSPRSPIPGPKPPAPAPLHWPLTR